MASSEHFEYFVNFPLAGISLLIINRINEISSNRAHVNENASMRAVAKFLRARASEHSCNFCEQFEQRPNFASTLKLNGPFDTPSIRIGSSKYQSCHEGGGGGWGIN